MRYLALALFAEGPTDHAFLHRLIFRSVTEICTQISDQPVEIPEQFIRPPARTRGRFELSRPEKAADLFGGALEALDLLFIHTDGSNNSNGAYEERVLPCCNLLHERFPKLSFKCVGVVPVYETEAWALADPEAIALALGTIKSPRELGLPTGPQDAERLRDPKEILRRVQVGVQGGRHKLRGPSILPILGDTVSLRKLRQMTAFQCFEEHLREALRDMWGMRA